MKNSKYGFMAAIFSAFVIVQFDFDNLKFETAWKGYLFLAGLIISIILMLREKSKLKK